MTMKTEDGRLIVVGGATRCGKSTKVKALVSKDRRISCWDPEAQWCELPGWVKVTTRRALAEALNRPGLMKVAYVVEKNLKEEFDYWAKATFHAGRYVGGLTAIGEELADVTQPGKAPDGWGILVRRGLKRAITIYAISQRWSEADKTAFGNATAYILFRQSSGDDIKYLARKATIPVEELTGLQQFEFIEKCAITGTTSKGKLRF